MRRRYPLLTLEGVTEERLRQERLELALESQRVRETTLAREQRQRELALERQTTQCTLELERDRFDAGRARADDMRRAAEFEQGARFRQAERERQHQAALSQESAALTCEQAALERVHESQADAMALARHKQRFERAEARILEQEQEDQALEAIGRRVREVPL